MCLRIAIVNDFEFSDAIDLLSSRAILLGMKNLAFEAVCKHFGSQSKLARELGVSVGAVNQIVQGRRPIPAHWCPIIEEKSSRAFLCENLRPDIRWSVLRAYVPTGRQESDRSQ